jgi:hypothetical protein
VQGRARLCRALFAGGAHLAGATRLSPSSFSSCNQNRRNEDEDEDDEDGERDAVHVGVFVPFKLGFGPNGAVAVPYLEKQVRLNYD